MSDTPAVAAVPIAEFVGKRVERFDSLGKLCAAVALDLKEMRHQVMQYEAKVNTFINQILAKKQEIAELEEQIKRKKIEAAGSFNNFRDSLQARELVMVKREAELVIREGNVKARAQEAENLISKAERVIGKQEAKIEAPKPVAVAPAPAPVVVAPAPAPVAEKRGPGRPKKGVPVSA